MNLQVRHYRVENFNNQGFIFAFTLGMNPIYYFGFKNSDKEMLFVLDRETSSLLLKSELLSIDLFKTSHEVWSIPEENEYIEVLNRMFGETLVQDIVKTFYSHKNCMTFMNKNKELVTLSVTKLIPKKKNKKKKTTANYNIDNDSLLI